MKIVSVKYEDFYIPKTFSSKEYAYYTTIDLKVGDIAQAPSSNGTNIALVVDVDISETVITNIKQYMKTITTKINKDRYLNFNEILEDVA